MKGTRVNRLVNEAFLRTFDLRYLDDLIRLMGLHRSYPVDNSPVYDLLNTNIYKSLALPRRCKAFSARHLSQGFCLAVFDRNLEGTALRQETFHELGHLLWHQDGRLHGSIDDPGGWVKREEFEANVVGCYLAAPASAVLELFKAGFTSPQVCEVLDITPKMLQLRAELMVARNELDIRSQRVRINL